MDFLYKFLMLASVWMACISQQEQQPETVDVSSLIREADLSHLPEIETDFSCEDRTFGYYADMDSNCDYFHLCHPVMSNGGDVVMAQFTFLCPNSTVFSQRALDCLSSTKAVPCKDSEAYFSVNDQFSSNSQEP